MICFNLSQYQNVAIAMLNQIIAHVDILIVCVEDGKSQGINIKLLKNTELVIKQVTDKINNIISSNYLKCIY